MDKKRSLKNLEGDDIKGFEEFIEGQTQDSTFLPRGVGGGTKKNEAGFEHFTFLTNDAERLTKLKNLLNEKLPFATKFDQSDKLIKEQMDEVQLFKKKLFEICNENDSAYRKSIGEIFDSFFAPPKVD